MARIAGVLAQHGVQPAGPPFARYHRLEDDRFAVEAAFPVSSFPVSRMIGAGGDVRSAALPGGSVARTVHVGPYDEMEPAFGALAS